VRNEAAGEAEVEQGVGAEPRHERIDVRPAVQRAAADHELAVGLDRQRVDEVDVEGFAPITGTHVPILGTMQGSRRECLRGELTSNS